MKKKILSILFIFTVLGVNSQSLSRFIDFNASTTEVTFSKLRTCTEDISCEYSIDGRVSGTYRLSMSSTVIRFPRSFSKCQFRFYYTSIVDDAGRIKPDIGIAVVDDIDIKYFESGELFNSYFTASCIDETVLYYIINGSIFTSNCVCSYYNSLAPDDLLQLFINQNLSAFFEDKCGKNGHIIEEHTGSRIIPIEKLNEYIEMNQNNRILIYDMNGKSYNYTNLTELNNLSKGIYLIDMIENGTPIQYKFIKD